MKQYIRKVGTDTVFDGVSTYSLYSVSEDFSHFSAPEFWQIRKRTGKDIGEA